MGVTIFTRTRVRERRRTVSASEEESWGFSGVRVEALRETGGDSGETGSFSVVQRSGPDST
jgi:hypothetical protein